MHSQRVARSSLSPPPPGWPSSRQGICYVALLGKSLGTPGQKTRRPPFCMSAGKSAESKYPSPSGGHEHELLASPLQLQRSSTLLYSAGRRIAAHERREPYLELIASGRWGHQFHRVPRQMAHWRQVQSTNCKVLMGLRGALTWRRGWGDTKVGSDFYFCMLLKIVCIC